MRDDDVPTLLGKLVGPPLAGVHCTCSWLCPGTVRTRGSCCWSLEEPHLPYRGPSFIFHARSMEGWSVRIRTKELWPRYIMRLSLVSPNSITGTTLTDRLLHPGRYTLNKCTLSGYAKADLLFGLYHVVFNSRRRTCGWVYVCGVTGDREPRCVFWGLRLRIQKSGEHLSDMKLSKVLLNQHRCCCWLPMRSPSIDGRGSLFWPQ